MQKKQEVTQLRAAIKLAEDIIEKVNERLYLIEESVLDDEEEELNQFLHGSAYVVRR